jgi:hypothetical protein
VSDISGRGIQSSYIPEMKVSRIHKNHFIKRLRKQPNTPRQGAGHPLLQAGPIQTEQQALESVAATEDVGSILHTHPNSVGSSGLI